MAAKAEEAKEANTMALNSARRQNAPIVVRDANGKAIQTTVGNIQGKDLKQLRQLQYRD